MARDAHILRASMPYIAYIFSVLRSYRSLKFGGKSQIALSSGHERDTSHHHGASGRYSALTGADAADESPLLVRRPFSHPRQLARSQLGLGGDDLAQLDFVPG